MFQQFLQYADEHPEAWIGVGAAACFVIALVILIGGIWYESRLRKDEDDMAAHDFDLNPGPIS